MSEYTLSQVSPTDKTTLAEIDALLQKEGIRRDGNLDYICAMFDEDYHVIGTGSCFGNTLRCFAVSSDHQGEGLLNQIITLTGGRSAEEVVFNSITSGASNDIEKATSTARAMITRFGMSDSFDMMELETVNNPYLGNDTSLVCSADSAAQVDKEVCEIIRSAHQKALQILRDNRDVMDKLAAYLLDASASKYQISELIPAYKAAAAFTCTDYPDAGRLADLFARMKAEITACGEDALYNEIEFPLAQVLADMTRTGVLVDKDGIEQFGVKLREELEQVLTRIHMETGSATFNPNSPKQLGEMLFDTMGLPHGKKTQRGWSTDAETLESLREYPLVEDVLQYRAYQKLNSTYVEGLLKVIGEDGRIHTRFNQTEARTGRLSSDNPNLQNIPIRTEMGSKLRAYFVAKPGCVLVDADYSQIELRILAHVTGDAHMQEAFLSGADIHRSTAAKIYNIRPEDVTPRLRSSAKAINFGIMYGKGAYSLSKDIGVSVKEAEAFLQTYLATFPNIDGYMEKTIADARQCGYVSTLFGRRRALPELNSNNHNIRASGERMARNTPIQGTAADVIKLAMVRVWRRLRDEKMESRLILTVHDELIVEAPEAEAEKAAQILREEMEGCVHYAVPLSTDVHTGKNWLEAH